MLVVTSSKRTDPVMDLYNLAAALRFLSEALPEEQSGVAYLLHGLGKETQRIAECLDGKL